MADDPGLMAQLKAWHVQVATQGQLSMADAQAVQDLVRDLLKSPKSYLGPRDCAAYAFQAAQIFPIIESVLAHSPSQARALCEDALKVLYKVSGAADDSSNGEFSDLVDRTTALLKLGLQADPPPAAWLKTWLSLAEKDPWGLLPRAGLIAAAGPAVHRAYSDRVAKDWHDWLKAHPEPEGPWDPERHKRRSAYLADLLEQGDDGAALEVMRSTARLPGEWADLLQWCEQRQRWREALELAQKAYKLHPKDWRIEDTLLRCYERDGWDEEALAIWLQRLRAHPRVEHYQSVLRAAQRAGRDRAAYRDELMAWAAASEKRVLRSGFGSHAKAKTVTDVSVRASWWLDGENDSAQALALVQQPGVRCQDSVLRRLALSLPPDQNATAVTFLQALFYENMERAKTPYQSELALVREVLQRMTAEQGTQWVAELLSQFKVKRNFIKELPIP
jgi:hypothetical protein